MFPISYFAFILIILLFIDHKLASLFYPYIVLQTIIGLLLVILYFLYFNNFFYNYNKLNNSIKIFRRYFDSIFPYNISKRLLNNKNYLNLFLILFIIFKVFILYIWPINLSFKAFLYSFYLLLTYIILTTLMYCNLY